MHLLTLAFGIMLLHEAYTLKCNECSSGLLEESCSTIDCPFQGQQCGALRIFTIAGGSQHDFNMTSCFSADQCVGGSVNYGVTRIVISSKCCNTDLCNTEPAPAVPIKSSPNGKKCFGCFGSTCTATLSCLGNEDHCISASVDFEHITVSVKGCASKQLCSTLATHVNMTEQFGKDVSCCQGDLCNSATALRAGLQLLLLLVPLLTFVILC